MKFRSETLEILEDQERISKILLESYRKILEIPLHRPICSNEECVLESPICDHAKYMRTEIDKHNLLIRQLKQEYLEKYPKE